MGQLQSQEGDVACGLTKEGNHRKAAMLELCLLQLEGPVAVLGGQVQGVKVAACAGGNERLSEPMLSRAQQLEWRSQFHDALRKHARTTT